MSDVAGWRRERLPVLPDVVGMTMAPSAHLKAAVLPTSVMVPFADGRLLLGVWQAIYLVEHRFRGRERKVVVSRV